MFTLKFTRTMLNFGSWGSRKIKNIFFPHFKRYHLIENLGVHRPTLTSSSDSRNSEDITALRYFAIVKPVGTGIGPAHQTIELIWLHG